MAGLKSNLFKQWSKSTTDSRARTDVVSTWPLCKQHKVLQVGGQVDVTHRLFLNNQVYFRGGKILKGVMWDIQQKEPQDQKF